MRAADRVVESLLRGLVTVLPRLPADEPRDAGERDAARRRSRGGPGAG